jgi:hypothetical protein
MGLLDLLEFSKELIARRNKAALLLTPDVTEQRAYANKLAGSVDAPHFDVLDRFQSDTKLSERLGGFSMGDLFALIAEQRLHSLVIISGVEFVLAAWLSQEDPKHVKHELCKKVELWERTPAFILVAQYDPVMAAYKPSRHTAGHLVIKLSETLSLQ